MSLKLRRRAAGIVLGAALGLSSLTACATDGVSASTVAQIGDETITTQEFQSALDVAYADPIVGQTLEDQGEAFRTALLNDMVSYEISKAVAAQSGVSVSDAEIDEMFSELLAGQSVEDAQIQSVMQGDPFTEAQLRMRLATNLVNAKFGEEVTGQTQEELEAEKLEELKAQRASAPEQFTTYNILATVTFDQVLAADWVSKANEQGMTLQEAVNSNPDPQSPVGTNEVSSESYTGTDLAAQPDVLQQLQAIGEGQTGAVVQGPDQTGNFTYVVVTMESIAQTPDEDLQQQASQSAQQEFFQAGMTEAAEQAKTIEVQVNPRYGAVEFPQQGLPSVTIPTPKTFAEPEVATDPSTETGVPGGVPGDVPGGAPGGVPTP